jgi:hypothetical protein
LIVPSFRLVGLGPSRLESFLRPRRHGDRFARIRLAAAALVVLALAIAAPGASAAPAWLAPTTFSTPEASFEDIAANGAGDSVMVWAQAANGPLHQDVEAVYRPAGGPFGAPEKIGDQDQIGSEAPSIPVVAIDAAGNAVALWRRIEDGTHSRIQVSFRPAGGDWSAQEPITPPDEFNANPHVVVDAAGEFVAVWTSGTASLEVEVARAAPGQPFGPPETVSDPNAGEADLAVNANGDVAVAWVTTPGTVPPTSFVQATTAPAGGDFGPVKTLSPTTDNADGPAAVIGPDGRTTVVWTQFAGQNPSGTISAASSSGLGTDFDSPQPLSVAGDAAGQTDATVDGSGTVTAVWDEGLASSLLSTEVFAMVAPPGGPFTGRQVVATGSDLLHPRVAAAPDGSAVFLWEDGDAGTLLGAVRDAGHATFGPAQVIADQDQPGHGRIAVDDQGNGYAAWFTFSTEQATGFDAAGPVVTSLDVPGSGAPGTPLDFSVTARDAWSGVAAVAWSFGDGSSDTGFAVSHQYASAGTYHVTVRVTDGLGNVTVEQRTVQVAAAAGGSTGVPGATGATGPAGTPGVSAVPGLPGGIAATIARVRIGHAASLAHGIARLPLSCPALASVRCSGRLTFTAGGKALGTARFSITPGRRIHVRVHLRRRVKRATVAVAQARPGMPSLAMRQAVAMRAAG